MNRGIVSWLAAHERDTPETRLISECPHPGQRPPGQPDEASPHSPLLLAALAPG